MEKCAECGKLGSPESILRCTGCLTVRYCSRVCQKRQWPEHKAQCRRAKDKPVNGQKDKKEDAQTAAAAAAAKDVSPETAKHSNGNGFSGTCKKCGLQGHNMKKCGKCQEVTYCSRDCQRGDWKVHRLTCQVDEVVTTDGFRKMEERNRLEALAARDRETAPGQGRTGGGLFSLLGNLHAKRPSLTWDEALKRAKLLFPGKKIVDKFSGLKNDLCHLYVDEVVAVVKITGIYPHFMRVGRCIEDREGNSSYVLFHTGWNTMPFFSYGQLNEGSFMCYQHAILHFFLDGTVGFRIDDPSAILVIEP